jgi:tetratricopeptide (TPR) repeat protein
MGHRHGGFALWPCLILSVIAINLHLYIAASSASREEKAFKGASTSSSTEDRRIRANEAFSEGNNHYQKKEFDDAIQHYKIAINLNPDVISYYLNLGNCLREVSEYEESVRILQKAVFLNEEHSKSWYNLGVTYQTMGLYNDAILSYNNATSLTPDYLNAHYNKGMNSSSRSSSSHFPVLVFLCCVFFLGLGFSCFSCFTLFDLVLFGLSLYLFFHFSLLLILLLFFLLKTYSERVLLFPPTLTSTYICF